MILTKLRHPSLISVNCIIVIPTSVRNFFENRPLVENTRCMNHISRTPCIRKKRPFHRDNTHTHTRTQDARSVARSDHRKTVDLQRNNLKIHHRQPYSRCSTILGFLAAVTSPQHNTLLSGPFKVTHLGCTGAKCWTNIGVRRGAVGPSGGCCGGSTATSYVFGHRQGCRRCCFEFFSSFTSKVYGVSRIGCLRLLPSISRSDGGRMTQMSGAYFFKHWLPPTSFWYLLLFLRILRKLIYPYILISQFEINFTKYHSSQI